MRWIWGWPRAEDGYAVDVHCYTQRHLVVANSERGRGNGGPVMP
ncbi:hypothetical protein M6B38_346065 [Iris pallida]|uniref:Uncharacterized protein n=1 Tax=Iris pallida TaxID=29817 RepID=A0AAX6GUH6_IRIPA|nr:hypothetical protein M6B38_349890 [Iris pallida]KAJ6831965.1 hypothetical protein M6B38_346065 [Iris pallida]